MEGEPACHAVALAKADAEPPRKSPFSVYSVGKEAEVIDKPADLE
jgi:hypothetical protein